ncbi:P-loop containing nucleoside triphosphate hydrolase protein [Nemania serpens]|nr:P-loop containing nucleoside triphosphate hydrolase protein [Nemania serpens]
MAERIAIAFGDRNHGFQVGQNSGSITAQFHLSPERPETPPKPSFAIPFRRDRDFVKRESILDRLHEACLESGSRAALVGLGGVGKSQLAIEHAYRLRDRFAREHKEVWVFWVHAGIRARVEEGFRTIADAVKIQGRNQPNADSADDIDIFYDNSEQENQTVSVGGEKRALWTYLPQSSNGSILVTTRDRNLALKLIYDHKDIIEVGVMDQNHALELLATKSGSIYDRDDGVELMEALECMPLAISQAAAYIQHRAPRASVKKYLDEFRRSEQKRSSLLNYDAHDLRRDRSISNSVMTTWQVSFDYIRSKRPSATDLLSLLSFFDPQGILEYLVRPTDQEKSHDHETNAHDENIAPSEALNDEFEEDIATLRNYCLISMNEVGDVFEMHGLVQLSTRKWLDAHGETEHFKTQYIHRLTQAFPWGHFENWGTCQQLFPHVERAIDYCPVDKESLKEWASLLYNGSGYSLYRGKNATAEKMASQCYNTRKMLLGPEHSDTLGSINHLASAYRNQGRWKEAEVLQVQVLETSKTVLGPDHPDTLTSMNNLALTYQHQGRWKEAESLQVQVLETRKIVLGPDHPDTLTSMNNLAYTWKRLGRGDDALELLEQGSHASIRVLGPEHPDTQDMLSILQDWRDEEPQTRERHWKPMVKNAITVIRTKTRKDNLHRHSEAS